MEHSYHTADYARNALSGLGLEELAYTAGIIHDAGKFSQEFKCYLEKAANGDQVKKGSVIHTFTAVRYLLTRKHPPKAGTLAAVSELIAYAAGAHHGLFDCLDENGSSGFDHRIECDSIHSDISIRNFFAECIPETELETHLQKSASELTTFMARIRSLTKKQDEACFYISLLTRLLLSAVIEGDRRDTAEFMNLIKYPDHGDMTLLWKKCLSSIEGKLDGLPSDTPISAARRKISDICRSFAEKTGGILRLHVPTGGGKTLSSLRYAAAHAGLYKKRRIIFTSPLLSILDQNAEIIREYVGDTNIILEHHSNVVRETNTSGKDADTDFDERELLCENWNSPIIITTLVQLLNTMFDGKISSIRRFQSLCDSVIVIDEVQTVPTNMLTLFNLACNFLANVCNTTLVLCSATQPCFERAEHGLIFSSDCEIVPYDEHLWAIFKRTEIKSAGSMLLEEIPDFALSVLNESSSLLIVCNKREQAEKIWCDLSSRSERCYHLSAAMCMAHRRDLLRRVKQDLDAGHKVILVSTQVIEAGVDISFGCVIRLCTGMDSIVQAAGRCNRNHESETPGPVYIVQCADENLSKLKEINRARTACISLINDFDRDASRYAGDLASDTAIYEYYSELYNNMPKGFQDYHTEKYSYYELMSENSKCLQRSSFANNPKYILNTSMKTAGASFEVFDNDTYDIIVPYGEEGKRIIAAIWAVYPEGASSKNDVSVLLDLVRRARPFTVSLYKYQYDKLNGIGCLLTDASHTVTILKESYYDENTGVITDPERRGIDECDMLIL